MPFQDDVVDEREDDYGEPGCTSFDDLHFGGGHGNGSGSNKSKKEASFLPVLLDWRLAAGGC